MLDDDNDDDDDDDDDFYWCCDVDCDGLMLYCDYDYGACR